MAEPTATPAAETSAASPAGEEPVDVLLVNMPLSPVDRPSLGLTLLAEALKREGFHARVLYPNLRFAARIGQAAYDGLALNQFANTTLAGEWIFSRQACPVADASAYMDHLRDRQTGDMAWQGAADEVEALCAALPGLVEEAAALVEAVAQEVIRRRPRMVGFSSCYNQHLACLAAARRVKELCPDCFVVLGGVNCNGSMGVETFRQFPFLDAVIAGPGEMALPALARRVFAGSRDLEMPGIYLRQADGTPSAAVEGYAPEPLLDTLPFPDYADFFEEAAALGNSPRLVPMEGSRGCWWGQKHHCVFCSENAESMRYRGKSPERFLEELRWLTARHPGCRIALADEILDRRLLAEAMPQLAAAPPPAGAFTCVKSNLRKEEVAALAAAGFDRLQPGIESLDDDILTPMRKGVTAIRNVQLLKWCLEHGVSVSWGLLFGFPFDRPEPYQRTTALLPSLTHMSPPGLARVVLQRYSPLTREAEHFGLRDLRPNDSYRFIYPFDPAALAALAFRFTARWAGDEAAPAWWRPLCREAAAWQAAAGTAFLFHQDDGQRLWVCDTRPVATRFLHVLSGTARAAYLACDSAQPLRAVAAGLPEGTDVAAAVARLEADRLMMTDKGLHLALGCRLNRRALPPPDVMMRFLTAKAGAV